MNIRIGAFSSEETIHKVKQYENICKNISIVPYTYEDPKESNTLVKQAYGCDVYFFTGPVPYLYAKDALKETDLPLVVVPFDQLMISNAFNKLLIQYKYPIDRISIDIMHKEYVIETLEELQLSKQQIYIYSFNDQKKFEISDIVDFHLKLWNSGKISFVLTSIIAVEKQLKEKGVPCFKMDIPKKNFDATMQQAKTLGELQLSKTATIIVGFIKLKNMDELYEKWGDFQVEKLLLSLHQILLNCAHEMDLSLYKNNNQFVIFGTKGSLEKLVTNGVLNSYIKKIETTFKKSVFIGFGSGNTAREAEDNAKVAITRALQDETSSCYLYKETGDFVYLLKKDKAVQKEPLINYIIQLGGVTFETANNFVDFLFIRNFKPFTTQDYATYGAITTRSAARTIKKMVDGNILQIAGEKKLYGKGRPRTIYMLKEN